MPDDFLFVSEEPAGRYVLPADMVHDLSVVAGLEEYLVEQLADALEDERGILTEDRVGELVQCHFAEAAIAESVARTIRNLPLEQVRQVLALVDRWRQVSKAGLELLPDDVFGRLHRNIDILIRDYPGVALMRKAQRLLRDTGNEFVSALFVCDLRPVFDKLHERVEGFVALANLRLRYVRQNAERDSFEIALTEDELKALIKAGQKARQKLKILRRTVPNLVQTRESSNE